MKTVLAFGAHPDDIEWRISGTLLRLSKRGYKIYIKDLTRGEKATLGTPKEREKEAMKAAKILKAERKILDFGDRNIKVDKKGKSVIQQIIKKYKPDIIFSPCYRDRHLDHENTGKLLKQYDPIFYLLHSPVEPTHIVDISDVFEQKMKSVYSFESQVTQERIEKLITTLKNYGKKINSKYGEAFFYKRNKKLPKIFIKI